MVAVLDVVVLVGLITFNIVMLGSYRHDLERIDRRVQKVEVQVRRVTDHLANYSEHQLNALWNRASAEVDREIVRARERGRS